MDHRDNETTIDSEQDDARLWIHEQISLHEGQLLSYVYGFLGDHDRAQDVVQDAFISLYQQAQKDLQGRERPWLFRVCRNASIDIMRKEKRMHPIEDDYIHAVPASTPSPGDDAEKNEQRDILMSKMATLPAPEQEVLRLKFHSGLSYKEIASITDRTVSHVGVLLHTAIKRLRSEIQEVA